MLARRGQWQAAQRAHLQLKLAHIAAVHAPVAAVVRARRYLVHGQWAGGAELPMGVLENKKFHAQHTYIFQAFCYALTSCLSSIYKLYRQITFIYLAVCQDAVDVHITRHRQRHHVPVSPARQHH